MPKKEVKEPTRVEGVTYPGPRSRSGARLRSRRQINAPKSQGIGPYFVEE